MKKLVALMMLVASPVFANLLSEAMIMHEDAVVETVATQGYIASEMSMPQLLKASEEADFALTSQVQVIDKANEETSTVTCTSQFNKTDDRSFDIISTICL